MGVAYECMKYANGHNLPITFVVEDNGMSVDTPTREVWGKFGGDPNKIVYYYTRKYPHHGCGEWVTF